MKKDRTYKKLGEVCDINYGTRVVQKKDGGSIYPVYGGGGATFRMDTYNREDCLVVARFAMSPKCTRIVKGKFFLNDSGLTLDAHEELYQDYLNWHIISLNDEIYQTAKGAAQKNLDVKAFTSLKIAIPPLSIQRSIVAELDLLRSVILKKKEQLRELDNLAQSLFYQMFGDPITNPMGWEIKKLGEVAENCDYMRKPITASDRIPGNIPYYGASGIVDYVRDYIFDGDYLLVSEDGANLLARSTPIAFSISGKNWVNNHAHVLKFRESYTQLYVQTLINLIDISDIVTGAVQPKLNQAQLNKFPLPLPPLSLQQSFAAKVSAIEAQKQAITQSIQHTEALLAQRMDNYFGI